MSKILNYFLKSWDVKVNHISKLKQFDVYSIGQVLSSLIAHDQKLAQKNDIGDKKKKN